MTTDPSASAAVPRRRKAARERASDEDGDDGDGESGAAGAAAPATKTTRRRKRPCGSSGTRSWS